MAQEKRVYTMTIAGLKRDLPLCRLNEHMSIAAFVIFGDVEITVASAQELLKKAPEFDVLITAEAKGIPLVYEMARQSGKPYYIARKYPKLYMPNPISVQVRSITTDKEQTLYLDCLLYTSSNASRRGGAVPYHFVHRGGDASGE